MTETVFTFGAQERMVGILTMPSGEFRTDRPAILLLNVGLLPRSGPFRLSVDLARRLAAAGFVSLRFDLSGLGDSLLREDGVGGDDGAVCDIRDAMDALTWRLGLRRFVLVGLCTGAHNAHRATMADGRVVGAVLIDGYSYRTPRFFLKRYLPFLAHPRQIVRIVRGRLAGLGARRDAATQPLDAELELGWNMPPRGDVKRDLKIVVDRTVSLLCIFTGDSQTRCYHNYRGQFRDAFLDVDLGSYLDEDFFREADHILFQMETRTRIMERIVAWAANRFGAKPA